MADQLPHQGESPWLGKRVEIRREGHPWHGAVGIVEDTHPCVHSSSTEGDKLCGHEWFHVRLKTERAIRSSTSWTSSWLRRRADAPEAKREDEMSDPRTCTRCGHEGLTEACPTCTAQWENRRDAGELTPDERAAELRSWGGVLEIDWSKVHRRIEELVGRPVWTHEMGTAGFAYLEHEILTGTHPSMDGVLAKLPSDKPTIVVEADA